MSEISRPQVVPVEVQWALWGKEDRDTQDYHLIQCSAGEVSQQVFARQVTRYSPGTLNELPQVSTSWLKGPDGYGSHLAIAIHETSRHDPPEGQARGRYDARGREITFTRHFCVRYDALAAAQVGYEALYNAVRDVPLPDRSGRPILLDVMSGAVTPGPQDRPIAQVVAAALLTNRPVCITGAGDTDPVSRLRFIDQVMAMLPYGTRACLSASTWVDSGYRQHRFRLFFASAPRSGSGSSDGPGGVMSAGDHGSSAEIVMSWPQLARDPESARIADQHSDLYLNWVRAATAQDIEALAWQRKPVHLGRSAEISKAVSTLPSAIGDDVPTLLELIAHALQSENAASLDECVRQLSRQLGDPDVVIDHPQCRQLIKSHDLMREVEFEVPGSIQEALFSALVRVAAQVPLSYQGYSHVADCAGGQLHDPLLRAIRIRSAPGSVPWVLASHRRGMADEDLFAILDKEHVRPDWPLRALLADMTRPALGVTPGNGVIALDFGWRYLSARVGDSKAALRSLGYLVPILENVYSRQRGEQVNWLRKVLAVAYDGRLGRSEVREILGLTAPSPAPSLAVAVVSMTRWKGHAQRTYFRACSIQYLPQPQGSRFARHPLLRWLKGPVPRIRASLVTRRPHPAGQAGWGQARPATPLRVLALTAGLGVVTVAAALVVLFLVTRR